MLREMAPPGMHLPVPVSRSAKKSKIVDAVYNLYRLVMALPSVQPSPLNRPPPPVPPSAPRPPQFPVRAGFLQFVSTLFSLLSFFFPSSSLSRLCECVHQVSYSAAQILNYGLQSCMRWLLVSGCIAFLFVFLMPKCAVPRHF